MLGYVSYPPIYIRIEIDRVTLGFRSLQLSLTHLRRSVPKADLAAGAADWARWGFAGSLAIPQFHSSNRLNIHSTLRVSHDTLLAFENSVPRHKLVLAEVGVEARRQAQGAYILSYINQTSSDHARLGKWPIYIPFID